jgi:hypothetical protein
VDRWSQDNGVRLGWKDDRTIYDNALNESAGADSKLKRNARVRYAEKVQGDLKLSSNEVMLKTKVLYTKAQIPKVETMGNASERGAKYENLILKLGGMIFCFSI